MGIRTEIRAPTGPDTVPTPDPHPVPSPATVPASGPGSPSEGMVEGTAMTVCGGVDGQGEGEEGTDPGGAALDSPPPPPPTPPPPPPSAPRHVWGKHHNTFLCMRCPSLHRGTQPPAGPCRVVHKFSAEMLRSLGHRPSYHKVEDGFTLVACSICKSYARHGHPQDLWRVCGQPTAKKRERWLQIQAGVHPNLPLRLVQINTPTFD